MVQCRPATRMRLTLLLTCAALCCRLAESGNTRPTAGPTVSSSSSSTGQPSTTTEGWNPGTTSSSSSTGQPTHRPTHPTTGGTGSTSSSTANSPSPAPAGCSDTLVLSTGSHYPAARVTCYDMAGLGARQQLRQDTILNPGTTCIFMSDGHLQSGLVMELFCEGEQWRVEILHA